MKRSTQCVHLRDPRDPYGASAPPIYQTATFQQPSATEFGEYDYTRSGNPTRSLVEQQIAELEGGRHCCVFTSGMAAITTLTRLLEAGDEIVAGDDLYGGTVRLLEKVLPRQGINVKYVDQSDVERVREALGPNTKLILIETPSNPFLRIADITRLAEIAHEAGALLAVDNSMMSPVLQRPLSLGADVVIHSATKFLCGHSDVTAGAIVTNSDEVQAQIAFHQNAEGAALAPFESWLLIRGLKTLALRVERQNASAEKIAKSLEQHSVNLKVYYPGFKNHPGHEIHQRQSEGNGAVICFTTGDAEFSQRIVEATKLFSIAVSFGSVGSTISLPYRMSHASIPDSVKNRLAPPPDLVRLSVGIEDVADLIEDLLQAIEVAQAASQEFADEEYISV